jgi:uncharacterized protein (TIGR02271 family)
MNTDKEFITDSLNRQQKYIGFEVQDSTGDKFGRVHHLWTDEAGNPQFVGVTAGWLFERHYIIPADQAEVNEYQHTLRLPYTKQQIKDAPNFVEADELVDADRERIYSHYGLSYGSRFATTAGDDITERGAHDAVRQEHMKDEANIRLKEEQLKVGKREVQAGGVRLRKIVRTETVNQPVELKREEIVIERVPASGDASTAGGFREEDIFIPLRREEAVVEKSAHVREEVRVGKKAEYERQQVTGEIRKEELKVDRDVTRTDKTHR